MRKIAVLAAAGCLLTQGCKKPPQTEHIKVTMKKYEIQPAVIHLKAGTPAILEISTSDVQHGFGVEALKIDESVQPGHTTEVAIDTGKKGEYPVECTIICGPHHDDMKAKIVVE